MLSALRVLSFLNVQRFIIYSYILTVIFSGDLENFEECLGGDNCFENGTSLI